MLKILKENEKVDLYLDNDDAGDKCSCIFIRVAQLFKYCLDKGIAYRLGIDDMSKEPGQTSEPNL